MQYPTYTGDHKTHSSNSFSFRSLHKTHQKMHRVTPVCEQKSIPFIFLLSHTTIAWCSSPILPPRARWNKPISCPPVTKHYPDFKHTHSRNSSIFGCTSTTISWEVFFPEQRPWGTGLQLRAMLRELEKCQKLRQQEQQKYTENSIWSNSLLGFSKWRNSTHLSSKASSCISRK